MRTWSTVGASSPNRARGSRKSWISSLMIICRSRFSIASPSSQLLAERSQPKRSDQHREDRQRRERRHKRRYSRALERDHLHQYEVVPRRRQIRDRLHGQRHLVDREDEPREQKGGQEGSHERDLACGKLRLGRGRNPVPEQQNDRQEQRRG